MSKKELKIYKINDKSDNFMLKHPSGVLWDCPHRLVICGRSMLSGKTTLLDNLLGQKDMYKDVFDPEDIFIISPTAHQEKIAMIVSFLDIPEYNVFDEYSDKLLRGIYKQLKDDFEEEKVTGHVSQKLIILDDIAYSGVFSSANSQKNSIINELLCNSRHYNINVWILCQKYSQLSTTVRQNASGFIFFETTEPELKQIADDHDISTDRRRFYREFRKATKKQHDFFMINYHKPESRYYHGFNENILFDNDDNNEEIDEKRNEKYFKKVQKMKDKGEKRLKEHLERMKET